MRTIRFRGKWVGDRVAGTTADKWEYGCLAFGDGHYYILSPTSPAVGWFQKKRVSPETIGQYTGLKDKDGVEIYEGDVVVSQYFLPSEVNYDGDSACFRAWDIGFEEVNSFYPDNRWEIIGNIHDNPGILEVSK